MEHDFETEYKLHKINAPAILNEIKVTHLDNVSMDKAIEIGLR